MNVLPLTPIDRAVWVMKASLVLKLRPLNIFCAQVEKHPFAC